MRMLKCGSVTNLHYWERRECSFGYVHAVNWTVKHGVVIVHILYHHSNIQGPCLGLDATIRRYYGH